MTAMKDYTAKADELLEDAAAVHINYGWNEKSSKAPSYFKF